MVDEFFLKSLIQITHGEIRLIDKERDIRRIGQTKEEEDPFFTDEIFLMMCLNEDQKHQLTFSGKMTFIMQGFAEKEYKAGFLQDQCRQLLVQHLHLK